MATHGHQFPIPTFLIAEHHYIVTIHGENHALAHVVIPHTNVRIASAAHIYAGRSRVPRPLPPQAMARGCCAQNHLAMGVPGVQMPSSAFSARPARTPKCHGPPDHGAELGRCLWAINHLFGSIGTGWGQWEGCTGPWVGILSHQTRRFFTNA